MINIKNKILTASWLSGLLSAEIFISTGESRCPDATPDLWKQPFSAVRDSGLRQNLFNMNIYSIATRQVYTSMSI